jgi:hypothetical protein
MVHTFLRQLQTVSERPPAPGDGGAHGTESGKQVQKEGPKDEEESRPLLFLFLAGSFSWSPKAEEYLHFEAFMSTRQAGHERLA